MAGAAPSFGVRATDLPIAQSHCSRPKMGAYLFIASVHATIGGRFVMSLPISGYWMKASTKRRRLQANRAFGFNPNNATRTGAHGCRASGKNPYPSQAQWASDTCVRALLKANFRVRMSFASIRA